jgi:aspartate/methionine/tyrosine aminotransferase
MMKIAPFKLERYFARYEFKAPYLLSSSDCEAVSIGDLLAYEPGADELLKQHWLGYTESQGSPELRQEITRLYTQITPEDVLVHSGAEEAIFNFINALFEPGDHIIVHAPCYQSLHEVARAAGCEVSLWLTQEQDGWELDVDWLRSNIRPNTRALIVNCPHNPTGYLMSAEKQRQLIDLARQHNLILFSDEVYRGLEHHPADRLPSACDLYEQAISLGVMSKTYGLAGLRIGWIATRSPDIYAKMAAFKDYLTICNSAPSEFLSIVALRHHEAIAQRNLDIIGRNLDLLDAFFAEYAHIFNWQRPKACSTAFPSLKIDRDTEAFCHDLVDKQGVLLVPSSCYDYGNKHFRVGFGRTNLPEALEHFDAYLRTAL